MKKKRWGISVLLVLVILLFAAVPASGRLTSSKEDEDFSDGTGLQTPEPTAEIAKSKEPLPPINILLIGADGHEGEQYGRSDAMLVLTVIESERRMVLSSFLRDIYLPIPGHGSDRLNAAYAIGGTELLARTLEENYGIAVDAALAVDFEGFEKIVDSLRGVELSLSKEEAEIVFADMEAGSGDYLLTGAQALEYVRIRELDNDFGRTERQRKLLSALWDQTRSGGVAAQTGTLLRVLPHLNVDGETEKLIRALICVEDIGDFELQTLQIPREGSYRFGWAGDRSILETDVDGDRKYWNSTIRG